MAADHSNMHSGRALEPFEHNSSSSIGKSQDCFDSPANISLESENSEIKVLQNNGEYILTDLNEAQKVRKKRLEIDKINEKEADLEEAKKYRNQNCIRRFENGEYSYYGLWTTSLEEIGNYSLGVMLYFWLIKTMAFAFFLMFVTSIYSLNRNNHGNGLKAEGFKQKWNSLTIANVNEVKDSSDLSDNESMQASLFIVDVLCCFLLIFFIAAFKIKTNLLVKKHLANPVKLSDFAVKVKGIPEETTDQSLIKNHFSKYGAIHEIALAKRYNGILTAYKKKSELQSKLSYCKVLKKRGKNQEKTIKKLEKEINSFDDLISENEMNSDKTHEELPTICVFIVFDSTESRNKCLLDHRKKIGCFSLPNSSPELYFSNKYPVKVSKAELPSCINFENLEVPKKSKRVRKLISFLAMIPFFILTMLIVYSLTSHRNSLPHGSVCENVDITQSFDYAKSHYKTRDESYCWCGGQLYQDINHEAQSNYCSDFFDKVSLNIFYRVLVSNAIYTVSFVIEILLVILNKFERFSTRNKQELTLMTRVFYQTFINTAVIVLLVNADFSIFKTHYWLPFFFLNGDYTDFTREWYSEVGSTITSVMCIILFNPHWINLFVYYPIGACKRKCGTRNCATQKEANDRFSGDKFDLAIKNSAALNTIFSCFFYSAGMPFLNLVCFLYLIGVYWIDKFLFLRHYAKPVQYGHALNNEVLKFLPFSVIIHCAFGLYMFGSDNIFPLEYGKSNKFGEKIGHYTGIVYIIIMAIAAGVYLWILGYKTCADVFKNKDVCNDREFKLSQEGLEVAKDGVDTYDVCKMQEFEEIVERLNSAAEKVKIRKRNLEIVNN